MKVGVILHDDGADVSEISIIGLIIVGGYHYAEGKLIVAADTVLLFVVIVLGFHFGGYLLQVFVYDLAPADCVALLLVVYRVALEGDVSVDCLRCLLVLVGFC